MDTTQLESLKTAALLILGWVWQQTRGHPNWPNWAGYLLFGAACVVGYLWATPGWNTGDWRLTSLGLFTFYMAARGSAASLKDARLAPPAR